jgi:hypothetical protein
MTFFNILPGRRVRPQSHYLTKPLPQLSQSFFHITTRQLHHSPHTLIRRAAKRTDSRIVERAKKAQCLEGSDGGAGAAPPFLSRQ